jgi:hypothetical protein
MSGTHVVGDCGRAALVEVIRGSEKDIFGNPSPFLEVLFRMLGAEQDIWRVTTVRDWDGLTTTHSPRSVSIRMSDAEGIRLFADALRTAADQAEQIVQFLEKK